MEKQKLSSLLDFKKDTPDVSTENHGLKFSELLGPFVSSGTTCSREQKEMISPPPALPAAFNASIPQLMCLSYDIRREFEANPLMLLGLNRGRRDAVLTHLERISGSQPQTRKDSSTVLKEWLECHRTQKQEAALQAYFEELALFTISEALLLKSWSDKGLRPWKPDDLKNLNFVLDSSLKPFIPIGRREGWQFTQRNIYSWYIPSMRIQETAWKTIDALNLKDEDPAFLYAATGTIRQLAPDKPGERGYDNRFLSALWAATVRSGLQDPGNDPSHIKRRRHAFTPTMRDGTIAREAPGYLTWYAMEINPFQLFLAELLHIWNGPCPPPAWTIGYGMEAASREQLPLGIESPMPSLLSRIADMEACDVGMVLEETSIRKNSKCVDAAAMREITAKMPDFKKFKSSTTTLGGLQACVTAAKLRPGGLLWWIREEPLSDSDSGEVIACLFERLALVCEWDFSGITHSLPSRSPLFPKHLYLFRREPGNESRMFNKPWRVSLSGQLRSHVEIPAFLAEAFDFGKSQTGVRGHWQLHAAQSVLPQKEWAARWPVLMERETIARIEDLKSGSVPLASIATVRPPSAGMPLPGEIHFTAGKNIHSPKILLKDGFVIAPSDPSWKGPIRHYLCSERVHEWIGLNAEHRGDSILLEQQLVKFIPVHRLLLDVLHAHENAQIPSSWVQAAAELRRSPENASGLVLQETGGPERRHLAAWLFVEASRMLEDYYSTNKNLLKLIRADGSVNWRELISIMPLSERTHAAAHPSVKLQGSLPGGQPITRCERIRSPSDGLLLATESGANLMLLTGNKLLADMLSCQCDGAGAPTWSELATCLWLPRDIAYCEQMASDILLMHGRKMAEAHRLEEAVAALSSF